MSVLDNNPQVGMVYTDHWTIDDVGNVGGLGFRCKIPYSPMRLLTNFMTHHFRLFRRQVYDSVGGIDPSFIRVEDYDFCLRVSEITQIYHLTDPLYYYRHHSEMRSSHRREEQRMYSKRAINAALSRRGMADKYRLVVVDGRYRLEAIG
jgi:GT2 family glycosyltransferase